MIKLLLTMTLFLVLPGCGVEPLPSADTELMARNGNGGGNDREVCGDVRCASGEVCCNASCGICTEPGGFCIQLACEDEPNGGGGGNGSGGGSGKAECVEDADCRTFSNFCDGCACEALAVEARDPKCRGDIVACFADPCQDYAATCEAGSCVLTQTTTL